MMQRGLVGLTQVWTEPRLDSLWIDRPRPLVLDKVAVVFKYCDDNGWVARLLVGLVKDQVANLVPRPGFDRLLMSPHFSSRCLHQVDVVTLKRLHESALKRL